MGNWGFCAWAGFMVIHIAVICFLHVHCLMLFVMFMNNIILITVNLRYFFKILINSLIIFINDKKYCIL